MTYMTPSWSIGAILSKKRSLIMSRNSPAEPRVPVTRNVAASGVRSDLMKVSYSASVLKNLYIIQIHGRGRVLELC